MKSQQIASHYAQSDYSGWQTAVTIRGRPTRRHALHCWQCVSWNIKASMEEHAHFHTRTVWVAHLAQFFVQSGGPGLSRRVELRAEHLLVPVDKIAVAQSDHLHTGRQSIEIGMWFWLCNKNK